MASILFLLVYFLLWTYISANCFNVTTEYEKSCENGYITFDNCECNCDSGYVTKSNSDKLCSYKQKDRVTAILLQTFVGIGGAGEFYLGYYEFGIPNIIFSVIAFCFCCSIVYEFKYGTDYYGLALYFKFLFFALYIVVPIGYYTFTVYHVSTVTEDASGIKIN